MLEFDISEMKNIQKEIVQIKFNNIDTSEMDMALSLKKMLLKQEEIEMRKKIILKKITEFHFILADIYYK